MRRKCKERRCDRPHKAFGLCESHYRKLYYQNHRAQEIERAIDYKRSINGRILVAYQKLRQRCEAAPRYAGLPYLTQAEFIAWAEADQTFLDLHSHWAAAGYSYRLTPTVDRIDPSQGYLLPNMQWLPLFENAAKRRNAAIGRAPQEQEVR
jgi:hypothetical protein